MAELAAQRGGDPGRPGKKDPLDVLVWRAERPGEPAWASRFGRGRPGWHVECAAIATDYLGAAFDVQAGGCDLVFPHHEFSASHARVAFAPREGVFARVYAHAGMVSYQGEKMSKSLGNLVFVNRLLAGGADPMAIRMALLAHHYRSDWEWTAAGLADAGARLARWRSALTRAEAAFPAREQNAPEAAAADSAHEVLAGVRARMRDDLDAPGALAVVDRWADRLLADAPTRITPADVAGAHLVADTVDALLGIRLRVRAAAVIRTAAVRPAAYRVARTSRSVRAAAARPASGLYPRRRAGYRTAGPSPRPPSLAHRDKLPQQGQLPADTPELPDARPASSLRVSSPAALLAVIPHLIGFWPAASVVVIGLAPPRDRIRVTLRYDLPDPPDADLSADIAEHAAGVLHAST